MAVDYDSKSYLEKVDAWWRATTYLSGGMIFLKSNPLFSVTNTPIQKDDVKVKPIGHWGTISGQTFLYAHANRLINKYGLNMFYIGGPGHGGQVMVTNSYLDGTYTDAYPEITQDLEGMSRLYKRFSFPGGIGSHMTAQTPGSLHEGGELGYSLSHATGAVLDNPDQIAFTVVGDGEVETGPAMTAWNSIKFLNPKNDGAVLPILDLNGFKISNPTIFSRMSDDKIAKFFEGLGWSPRFLENDDIHDYMTYHEKAAKLFDQAIADIKQIQKDARENGKYEDGTIPAWPVVIARLPKGWGGPKKNLDGDPIEGSFRAHQVPLGLSQNNFKELPEFEEWMNSYKPAELFNTDGSLKAEVADFAPKGDKRMAANPVANGGRARGEKPETLDLPNWKDYANDINESNRGTLLPDGNKNMDMNVLSTFFAGVATKNPSSFRIFGPDETMSNRLWEMFKITNRQWMSKVKEPNDQYEAPEGRILDAQLSEHQAEGWLEGYTLTGRTGVFTSYESFLRVVDSMTTQHFKWIRQAAAEPWRNDYPSLNLVSTSTVFQQDHNGYTHQDPGMLTHLAEKKSDFIRQYLPADGNTLLAVFDRAFKDRQKVNHIVASKQPRQQWFSIDEAEELATKGLKTIDWASTVAEGEDADIVFASAGVEPTIETLAAVDLINDAFPAVKMRYVNVVELERLQKKNGPLNDDRALSDSEFSSFFGESGTPVVFGFHGYEDLIESFFYERQHLGLHVHGYREDGDITTAYDMRVYSELDRFHQAKDAVNTLIAKGVIDEAAGKAFDKKMDDILAKHFKITRDEGRDIEEFTKWEWTPLKK
ncbi:phosphoketolase family protein [Levilactobacillus brevis]|jgi:xylulose-5-phosphate/fructose-6-phosphate phosphoketolase|uniref:Phosphoketolase n=1 Tax=Levilactobacillus brevis (strain ATCC 367 / BCRC 12310 / CIP 105137 / JCM 1170 / LMG 11437 / NCIMB 947 / NCTC 947) TaxID=387344 RepID=Q03T34_LEVBA|nr:phosphoketolase family protein [Levilactobacillus brevis]ABJ63638.1 Phosphoketolase [Levilactobacillus brevis ATCC 367]ARW49986.1 Phosphoketolase [Levilactobacillus brevis]KWT47238.1 phosphoketolase [Levilactobacillus brevis]KWU40356.1 phosphoketolase [Levilactobacillus brevis]MBU5274917.1 phosphoketolase family protein [Levilactobacillus brevis]